MGENKNIIEINKSFKDVFKKPSYVILFFIIALAFFLASFLIARYQLLAAFSGLIKIKMFWFLLRDPQSTFTSSSLILVIILSFLSAINIVMMIFYVKRRISLEKNTGVGLMGMILGFLGVGCASCGSLVLSSIFGLAATTSFIGILPFGGLEFGILGVFMLLFSTYLIAKKIQNPLLCKIDH
ncbi:MAG: hypothetical protein WCS88_01155 [Patescibacteria group bacterium]|jgi:hypothetical protein